MRRVATILLLALVSAAPSSQPTTRPAPAAKQDGIAVYFSPKGGAAEAVVVEIGSAAKSLDVAAYTITHPDISRAIVRAHERGVAVRVMMDPTQTGAGYSAATPLDSAGVPVFVEAGRGLLHHKFAAIDAATIITGSMNWTRAGDQANDEDLLVIRDRPQIVEGYQKQFAKLVEKAKPYQRTP